MVAVMRADQRVGGGDGPAKIAVGLMAVAAVDPGRGTKAVGAAASPVRALYDVIAIGQRRDAGNAHLVAGGGGAGRRADQRVAGTHGATDTGSAAAPGHRAGVGVPLLAIDDVIAVAGQRRDDGRTYRVAGM